MEKTFMMRMSIEKYEKLDTLAHSLRMTKSQFLRYLINNTHSVETESEKKQYE